MPKHVPRAVAQLATDDQGKLEQVGADIARRRLRAARASHGEIPPNAQPFPLLPFKQRHKGLLKRPKGGTPRFTQAGLVELEKQLLIGATAQDVADWFCITKVQAEAILGEGGQCHNLARHCAAVLRGHVRESQLNVASDNATMAVFLGKQYLGQKEEQPSQTVNVQHYVVGTMPDYTTTPEQWLHHFQPATISKTEEQ